MENLERVLDWVNEEGDLEAMITRISIPFGLGHL